MLEGLDEVPWHRLQHAYGPADDVPGLIRDLVAPEPALREAALHELFGNIHHQRTLYEATAPAVPFLVEVALAEDTHLRVRVELLWLLDAIAGGGTDEEGRAQSRRGPAGAAKAAVAGHLPRLLPFLSVEDDAVGLSAALLTARFPERAEESAPLVRRRFDAEADPRARRLLAGILVRLGDEREELIRLVRAAPDDDTDPDYRDQFGKGDDEADFIVLEDLLGKAIDDVLPPHDA